MEYTQQQDLVYGYSELLVARMAEAGVLHQLVVFPGLDHAWPAPGANGQEEVLAWFEKFLLGGRRLLADQ